MHQATLNMGAIPATKPADSVVRAAWEQVAVAELPAGARLQRRRMSRPAVRLPVVLPRVRLPRADLDPVAFRAAAAVPIPRRTIGR